MKHHLKIISLFIIFLIVSLPICFAVEINLQYDSNGNLVTGDGFYRTYNSLNQLYKVYNGSNSTGTLLEEYTFDPIEERVAIKKVFNTTGGLKETVYYFTQNNVRIVNSSGTFNFKYIYHEGQLIAQVNPDGSEYYIHGNHEGSSSVVTNQSGAVIETTNYDAYGNILSNGTKTRYNYENKEYDSVIKSTDFNFRQQGIYGTPPFQQPDSIISNLYNPQALNRYMFELGNPMKNIDPTGHSTANIFEEIKNNWQWGNLDYFSNMMDNINKAWINDNSWQATVVKEGYTRTPYLSDTFTLVNWATTEGMVSNGVYYDTPNTRERLSQSRKDASFAFPSLLLDSIGETSSIALTTVQYVSTGYNLIFGRNVFEDLFNEGTNLLNNANDNQQSTSSSSSSYSSGGSSSQNTNTCTLPSSPGSNSITDIFKPNACGCVFCSCAG